MIMSDVENKVIHLSSERNISHKSVIGAIEQAVVDAAYKKFGRDKTFEAIWNQDLGEVEIYEWLKVVGNVTNPLAEIDINKALSHDKEALIGDSLGLKVNIGDIGRIAIQTAKQSLAKTLREAEQEKTYCEFSAKIGTIMIGIIVRFDTNGIIVDLNGTDGFLPKSQQIRGESYRQGDRIDVCVIDVSKTYNGTKVTLSRTDNRMISHYMADVIPEIRDGTIKIDACSRLPGERAKVAVSSADLEIDPVRICIGRNGNTIRSVAERLGETIDIIQFDAEPIQLAVNAMWPIPITKVFVDAESASIDLMVEPDNISRAIGYKGQNIRLITQLVGLNINIIRAGDDAEYGKEL